MSWDHKLHSKSPVHITCGLPKYLNFIGTNIRKISEDTLKKNHCDDKEQKGFFKPKYESVSLIFIYC